MKWTRDWLKQKGYSDSDVGWKDGAVTLKGKNFITPSKIDGGKSYASGADLGKAYDTFKYSNMSPDTVGVRDFMQQRGQGDMLGWDANRKQATIGGQVIGTPEHLSGGRSYYNKDTIQGAVNQYKKDRGHYADTGRVDNLLDWKENLYQNPEQFKWDANQNQDFINAKNRLTQQGQDSARRASSRMAIIGGTGMPTSASAQMAQGAEAHYDNLINDAEQVYRDRAYNEWRDSQLQSRNDAQSFYNTYADNRAFGENNRRYDNETDKYNREWNYGVEQEQLNRQIETLGAYHGDYQAEINNRQERNPNDPLIPYLQQARQMKIQGMQEAEIQAQLQQMAEIQAQREWEHKVQMDRGNLGVRQGQLGVQQGQLGLAREKHAWSQDPDNPAYAKAVEQLRREGINESDEIGELYVDMMGSGNPYEWLTENADVLSTQEINEMYNLLKKHDPVTAQMMANLMQGLPLEEEEKKGNWFSNLFK